MWEWNPEYPKCPECGREVYSFITDENAVLRRLIPYCFHCDLEIHEDGARKGKLAKEVISNEENEKEKEVHEERQVNNE